MTNTLLKHSLKGGKKTFKITMQTKQVTCNIVTTKQHECPVVAIQFFFAYIVVETSILLRNSKG